MKMAIALPVFVDEKPVGTCFIGGKKDKKLLFVTTLHHLGYARNYAVGLPPHMGDMAAEQIYPLPEIQGVHVELVYVDPIFDLAVLMAKEPIFDSPIPRYCQHQDIKVGDNLLILGYPFISIGSFLETAENSSISALGKRRFMNKIFIKEIIIAHLTHQGSSGSPIIKRQDGSVCGMVRGCLAPPDVVAIGNIPIGSDSNITYGVSSQHIQEVLLKIQEVK